MRLYPAPPDIGETDGFTPENDIFGYEYFGGQLMQILTELDQPLTVMLDGDWGSGKTTFIKQFAGLLRNHHIPVIHFDAFAHDFEEDAFTALAAEIAALHAKTFKKTKPSLKTFVSQAGELGGRLLPTGARIVTRVASAGVLDVDDVKNAGAAAEAFVKETGLFAEKHVQARLEDAIKESKEKTSKVESFKKALADIATELSDNGEGASNKPLIFIIDELDRCKPSFALDIIEKIKHLYSSENIHFLIVTNLKELSNIVKGAYGADFDGNIYLSKFYELRLSLPTTDTHQTSISKKFINHASASIKPRPVDDQRTHEFTLKYLLETVLAKSLSLRSIERIMSQIALCRFAFHQKIYASSEVVFGLAALRVLEPTLFTRATEGTLTSGDVLNALNVGDWGNEEDRKYFSIAWRSLIDVDVSPIEKEANRYLSRYQLYDHNKSRIIRSAAQRLQNFKFTSE